MKGEGRMLNGIWMAMIVLAFVGAVCTGRWTALSAAAADGARQAVETVLLLLGAIAFGRASCVLRGRRGLQTGFPKFCRRSSSDCFRITKKMKPCAKKYR